MADAGRVALFGTMCLFANGWTACGGEGVPEPGAVAGGGAELRSLRKQVDDLAEALASARSEADALRSRIDAYEFGRSGTVTLKPAGIGPGGDRVPVVLEVNDGLRMAVLDVGARDGIRPGVLYAVAGGKKALARLRVVDVRNAISGAVILADEPRAMPKAGERLMRVAGTEK